jgi:putative ABC transport system permease protein
MTVRNPLIRNQLTIWHPIGGQTRMLKNYFLIAWRNLLRNKGFSIINILGLAIGMASATLILLWVQYVASFDQFHSKLDRLYEVFSNDKIDGTIRTENGAPSIMTIELKKDYPEIEGVSRINWGSRNLLSPVEASARPGPASSAQASVPVANNPGILSTGNVVDPDFLKMFDLPFVAGDPNTALNDPQAMVVTKRLARQLFHTDNVLGRTIRMGRATLFKITGILEDEHRNSMFRDCEYYCSLGQQEGLDGNWAVPRWPTFVLLRPNTNIATLNNKLRDLIPTRTGGRTKTAEFIYPVSRLGLHGQFVNGKETGGFIIIIRAFTLIAIFIILIACINFMNLSTAYSQRRAKEVGIRKVTGALRPALLLQFLGESLLTAILSGITAMLLVQLVLPSFNRFMQTPLHLDYHDPRFWMAFIGFILITGILAGSYPAFVLSSFKPVTALKGRIDNLLSTVKARKVLVVFQFSTAIVLIISTIIITRQIEYARTRQTGYDRDHLISMSFFSDGERRQADLVRTELLSSGAATAVTKAFAPLTDNWGLTVNLKYAGRDPSLNLELNRYAEDGALVKTAGMQLIQGRDIDPIHYPTDSTACLINESALAAMKFKDPIGQLITDDQVTYHVIGVIKNYIQESPYQPIRPMIIEGAGHYMGVLLIRLNGGRPLNEDLATAEKIFRKYNPLYPFEYSFVEEDFAIKFRFEQFVGRLSAIFAGLVIFISCLGLFGLAAYTAHARIKEIGIRKVLGATVTDISLLLSRDFIRLIAVSILVAIPVAWLLMDNWLSAYDYRISITWDIFALAGAGALLIALATVSYQAIKAALANPVNNLRITE